MLVFFLEMMDENQLDKEARERRAKEAESSATKEGDPPAAGTSAAMPLQIQVLMDQTVAKTATGDVAVAGNDHGSVPAAPLLAFMAAPFSTRFASPLASCFVSFLYFATSLAMAHGSACPVGSQFYVTTGAMLELVHVVLSDFPVPQV